MNTLEITRKIINENNIIARKSFGQNFLIDDEILSKIIEVSDIKDKDKIIEIGPGLGNLTQYILEKNVDVIAFEIDKNMKEILDRRFNSNKKLKIVMEDILKADISKYIEKNEKVKIIANLPYYITTPIIFKLLEESEYIEEIIVMVQKEVAERLVSKPHSKDFGVLTVNVNYRADVEKEFDVPRESFIPSPNVTSSVIKITPNELKRKGYGVVDENLLSKVIKASFSARRKKLINSLCISGNKEFTKDKIEQIIEELNIDKNARAEELEIMDFVNITNEIQKMMVRS